MESTGKVLELIEKGALPRHVILDKQQQTKALSTNNRARTFTWVNRGALESPQMTIAEWLQQAGKMSAGLQYEIANLQGGRAEHVIHGRKLQQVMQEDIEDDLLPIRAQAMGDGIAKGIAMSWSKKKSEVLPLEGEIGYLETKLGKEKYEAAKKHLDGLCHSILSTQAHIKNQEAAKKKTLGPKSDERKILQLLEKQLINHIQEMKGNWFGKSESESLYKSVMKDLDNSTSVVQYKQERRNEIQQHPEVLAAKEESDRVQAQIDIRTQQIAELTYLGNQKDVATHILFSAIKDHLDYSERENIDYWKRLSQKPFMDRATLEQFNEDVAEMNLRIAEREEQLHAACQKYCMPNDINQQRKAKNDLVNIVRHVNGDIHKLFIELNNIDKQFYADVMAPGERLFNNIQKNMQESPTENAELIEEAHERLATDVANIVRYKLLLALCVEYPGQEDKEVAKAMILAQVREDKNEWEEVFAGSQEDIIRKMQQQLERCKAKPSQEVQHLKRLSDYCNEYCGQSTQNERRAIRAAMELMVGEDAQWLSDLLEEVDALHPPISEKDKEKILKARDEEVQSRQKAHDKAERDAQKAHEKAERDAQKAHDKTVREAQEARDKAAREESEKRLKEERRVQNDKREYEDELSPTRRAALQKAKARRNKKVNNQVEVDC
jgi:hypothetical protein